LGQGHVVAAGTLEAALTSDNLSACFELPLRLAGEAGRFTCRAV
jgi:hypothetical protein